MKINRAFSLAFNQAAVTKKVAFFCATLTVPRWLLTYFYESANIAADSL